MKKNILNTQILVFNGLNRPDTNYSLEFKLYSNTSRLVFLVFPRNKAPWENYFDV